MKDKQSIKFESVEKIGVLNIIASITLGVFTFAMIISVVPRAMGEYLPPWPLFLESYWFFLAIALSLILAHVPIMIRTRTIVTELRKLNESVMLLTDSLSVNLRTGMNFIDAIRKAMNKVTSPVLRTRLSILLSMLEVGENFETAVKKITVGLPPHIVDILNVFIPASESGGRAGQVIMVASDFTRRIISFERSKRSSLSPYFYISFMAIGVFEGATLFLLYLIKNFETISQEGMSGFITSQLSFTEAWTLVYYMNIIVVVLSSIFTSKVVRGKIKFYSDYLIAFMILHLIILGILPIYMLL